MACFKVKFLGCLFSLFLINRTFADDEPPQRELFTSTPDQVATLTSEYSYLVGGLISPLSGQPVLRQVDMIVKGAQDIILSRSYISPFMPVAFPKHKKSQDEYDKKFLYYHLRNNYKGWEFLPHMRLQVNPSSGEIRLSDPSGMTLNFRLSGPNFSVTTLASPTFAISNITGSMPSGKSDPRNTRIAVTENGNKTIVYATDGSIRFYLKKGRIINKNLLLFLLEKEILPNGKILRYRYSQNQELELVESLDPKERFVYASIQMTGSPWLNQHCHFTSSSGMTVDYNYERRSLPWKIENKIVGGGTHIEQYSYTASPILTSVSSPFYRQQQLRYCGRFLLEFYSGREDIFTCYHSGFGVGDQHFRVHKLSLPVASDDGFYPVYELTYQPPVAGIKEGSTTINNGDGTFTVYHFSKNLLTTNIKYIGQDKSLKKEKVFSWDEKNWLKLVEMKDGHQNILYKKAYEYDGFGNPILEIFTGNLTGQGKEESYTIKRTFSNDGKNLLLQEEDENGKVTCFSYLPNTNLITTKLTKDHGKIILREFSVYDDCHNLIQTISDDGGSEDRDNLLKVSQRLLTTYTLRQSAPFLHMPEWIEQTYWEAGSEKHLKKNHIIYDQHGNIAQEDFYDAEGKLRFTIYKTYNERGDLLTETNRFGQQAIYTYDLRGRPSTTTNFSHKLQTTFRYDAKGRLREHTEKGIDGIVHGSSSEYDFHDRKTQARDLFQNTTHYTYDPLADQVIKTDFPSIASVDGKPINVSTFSTYDSLGLELTKTDANGNTTSYRYNAYGSPIEINYPDGSKEYFTYTKKGTLASHTNPDGLTINYTYDVLGRVLSKIYLSGGQILAEETFTYNGFNLLTETDKEGNVTTYTYDGAGRKIREECCGRMTDFSYDSMGWLSTIVKHNQANTLLVCYKRDLEGRILEESKTDTSQRILYKITYSYDVDGNRETITRYINGKEATDTFFYDSFRRMTEHQDAKQYFKRTTYNESFANQLGQKVLQTITVDPLEITRIETQDALARIVRKEALNPPHTHISCQELTYDPQGNLQYQRDHVYESGHLKNTQVIKYTHTPNNQIASTTRAFGTKNSRTMTYTYFPSGKTATKTLPDGVTLSYSYHPLGFMSRLDSSDGKIHHLFEYNLLGYLEFACDENQKNAIERLVDPFGNVIQELFPQGLEVKKDYDDFNRLISLKMGSQGEILYTYDPLFLRKVTRTSPRGDMLYEHVYDNYDLDGNLISESLIGNLGQVIHATDFRGQKTSISSPYFSQECSYDGGGNVITSVNDNEENHYSYDGLSQLISESGPAQILVYGHDSLYNRIQKNGKNTEINELNELISLENTTCTYDLRGNLILKKTPEETFCLNYDPLNRLIEVTSEKKKIHFMYDPLGRRLSKIYTLTTYLWKKTTRENYLYHGQNEIGDFATPDNPKNLRVLGFVSNTPVTIGIELEGQVFASLQDVQGNVRRLIDIDSGRLASNNDFTAFGEELQSNSTIFNPWRFASKRFDPETGLINFGKRYYDPTLARWLTTDPQGFIDSANLYQYVFNNPFRYQDPDGQFAFAIPLLIWGAEAVIPALSTYVVPIIYGAIAGAVAYGGYKAVQAINGQDDSHASIDDYTQRTNDLEQAAEEEKKKKSKDVYAPNRPLPMTENGVPIPDTDAPHTQLGTRGSKRRPGEAYPQAREFDKDGKPVKTIDFTDHGEPLIHPNPHEHPYKPNPTGGTPQRGDPKPLENWKY